MIITEKHNLLVIEDAAQALRATFKGKKGGSFGLAGCFSFYPAKVLGTAGDGGLVLTNDEEFAEKIRTLRDNGRTSSGGQDGYGFCSRLDNLHAAILNVKLKHLPDWIEKRRGIANLYHGGLSDLQELKLPPPPLSNNRFFDVYQNYVVRAKERDRLVAYLEKCGIEVLVSWYLSKPLHYHEALNLTQFQLPKTEEFAKECVSLPLNTEISDEQVESVIDVVNKFYKEMVDD